MRAWTRRLLTGALLLGLPVVLHAPLWVLGGVAANADDLIYYLPTREYIGEQLRAGHLPLWNPFAAMGTTVAADPQSGLWYPATLLFTVLPPLAAYSTSLWLHYVIAGWGMYRWLRSLRREWRAALLGAVAFEFCAHMVAHRQHLTIHHTVAWLPWMFYAWQRFAAGGGLRYAAMGAGAFGVQLLVQHIQPVMIGGAMLTAYVVCVLWGRRRSLWWEYPTAMGVGACVGAVQMLPTWFHFGASGRGTPAYHLFIENSWSPISALMLLFPMMFGSSTPNVWSERWWGVSHLCEQWPYATILVFILAVASLGMVRRRPENDAGSSGSALQRWSHGVDRELVFWWAAVLVALLIALGGLTPLSKILFHIPVYRSLRVPARWILVWSLAFPVLASWTASQILRNDTQSRRVVAVLGNACRRVLPLLGGGSLVLLMLGVLLAPRLEELAAGNQLAVFFAALGRLQPGKPAIWVPIVLMLGTGFLTLRWAQTRCSRLFVLVFSVFLLDLATVVPFVEVDTTTYTRADLRAKPALAQAIERMGPSPGERLLVPRLTASYDRPLEVLWPEANVTHRVATLNGYGPLWPAANRLLLRFMPWGANEDMLELLRNPDLLRGYGVRFLAARSQEERELLDAASWPELPSPGLLPIAGTEHLQPTDAPKGAVWEVRIDAPGLYRLALDVEPDVTPATRWFVRLELSANEPIVPTRSIEPVDLSAGPRKMRFVFRCDRAVGTAFVRIKSEVGSAVRVGRAVFGQVAAPGSSTGSEMPRHLADLEGGVTLYELPGAAPLVRWAGQVRSVSDLAEVVELLQAGQVGETVLGEPGLPLISNPGSAALEVVRPSAEEIHVAARASAQGVLVVNESYDQGWTADVDGVAAAVHRINAICMGIVVEGGEHTVVLRYHPRGLLPGAAISLGAASLIGLGLAVPWPRRRRGRKR